MAVGQDVKASSVYVQLYLRDKVFRQQFMEDQKLLESAAGEAPVTTTLSTDNQSESYQYLGDVADEALEVIYQDTLYLADETERLADAIYEVIDGYSELSGFQQEGITLGIGGGMAGQSEGFDYTGLAGTGEIEGTLEKGALSGAGMLVGQRVFQKTLGSEWMKKAYPRIAGIASDYGETALDKLTARLNAGSETIELPEPLHQPTAEELSAISPSKQYVPPKQLLDAPSEGGAKWNAGLANIAKQSGVVTAELVPNVKEAGVVMAELATPIKQAEVVMAELVPSTKQAGIVMAELVPSAKGAGQAAVGIAGAAATATPAVGGLTAMMGSLYAMLGPVLIAAAALLPLLAGLDIILGGTLTESGYFPDWLKTIGEVILILNPPLLILVGLLKVLWDAIKLCYAIMKPFIYAGIIAMKVAIEAILAPFTALSWLIKGLTLPFNLAYAAVDGFVYAIKSLPAWTMAAVRAIGKLVVRMYELGKSMASATFSGIKATITGIGNAVTGAIRGIGAGIQTTGKWMAILGGGMTAAAATIVAPLTVAANKFAEHGEAIQEIMDEYELTAEAASVYAYAASQTGMSVKDLTKAMKEDSDAFKEWKRQAEASGAVVGGDAVTAAVALTTAHKRLKDALRGVYLQLGQAVAPIIAESTELMVGAIRGVTRWIRENQALIATAFRVASRIAMVGTALATVGGIIMSVGAAISPLTALLAAIAAGMAVIEVRTGVGRNLWSAYSDSVVRIYETIKQFLLPIIAETQRVIGGITNAIKAGDFALAARIAWGGLQKAWIEGLLFISERTTGTFSQIAAQLAGGDWSGAAETGMNILKSLWLDMQQVADDTWQWIVDKADWAWGMIQDGFDVSMTWLEKGWATMFDQMKIVAGEFIKWFGLNVALPINRFLAKYDVTKKLYGASTAGTQLLADAATGIQANRNANPLSEQLKGIDAAAAERKAQREQDQLISGEQRELAAAWRLANREAEQSGLGATPAGQPGDGMEWQKNEAKWLREGLLNKAIEDAAAAAKAMAQPAKPDEAAKAGEMKSFVTSSAYVFGQFAGGGKKPEEKQVDLQQQIRDEIKEGRKERGKMLTEISELSKWAKRNPKIEIPPNVDMASAS